MGPYQYSQLAECSIRLLRLIPHPDRQSHIHCQLFDFPLSDSTSTCQYEALSYVWGSDKKPFSISVNHGELHIGANLHAALGNLRHDNLERVLWIDALCINQDDTTEKGQQVQLMAKIYAKAHCVIVWLREGTDESDEAIQEINGAAFQSLKSNNDSTRVLSLLRRPWFERIWVLQEVAAPQHILIRCGDAEIDGHLFCRGLSVLMSTYKNCESIQSWIYSLTRLIQGAIGLPRHIGLLMGRFSLAIRPFYDLIEMYHTRKATDRRDKVYALLGMSTDVPSGAGLSVNYNIPWSQLFRSLIKYAISDSISATTWDDREIAVIKGKAVVLGEISSVERNDLLVNNQTLSITWKNAMSRISQTTSWTLDVSAKLFQAEDVLCLFQGATRPTIIRRCGSYWAVIRISMHSASVQKMADGLWNDMSPDSICSDLLQPVTTYLRDFLLIWDWDEHSIQSLQNQENRYVTIVNEQFDTGSLSETIDNIINMVDMGLVLRDLQRYTLSEDCIRRAMAALETEMRLLEEFESASSISDTTFNEILELDRIVNALLHVKGGWLPLVWASQDGYNLVVKLIQMRANPNEGDEEGRLPLSWAAENGHETLVHHLLSIGDVDPDRRDSRGWTSLQWAVFGGHETIVKRLVATQKVDPDAKQEMRDVDGTTLTPLEFALASGYQSVVEMLLETYEVDLNAADEGETRP
ncbi:hypothetical protein FSST1_006597 [Fusarium sambucinum]